MRANYRNTAILLLAAYVSAVTAGAGFHEFGAYHARLHPAGSAGSPDCSGCAGRRADDGPAPDAHQHRVGESRPAGLSGAAACAVCKFLAQKPIPARHVCEVTAKPLERRLPLPKRIGRTGDVPCAYSSRAPPRIA